MRLAWFDDDGHPTGRIENVSVGDLSPLAAEAEHDQSRWVFADTAAEYPLLLAGGVRVARSHDLRLAHAILFSDQAPYEPHSSGHPEPHFAAAAIALFDVSESTDFDRENQLDHILPSEKGSLEVREDELEGRLRAQLAAVRSSEAPNRLRLLLAAESSGALVAAEMAFAGLPWREDVHDRLLTELLGPEPAAGHRPERLELLAERIRIETGVPQLNPDSPADLVKALRGLGLQVASARSRELQQHDHPVIAPVLEYKKLARLLSANGWSWMASWVHGGRFVPEYVPGGVVSGRWATRGGGALQLPKQVRRAVTADAGWKLVVADAAQLEPRILAALSGDRAMAAAGRSVDGRSADLYAGIVASGAVETRAQAKVAMLGAMYGATTGESGRLLPRLARVYPEAMGFVEAAARAGERGDVVSSRLGRRSPRPNEAWWEEQTRAAEGAATEAQARIARRQARDWGRFTRNFVVQASAADWALCWIADLRRSLSTLGPAISSAPSFADAPGVLDTIASERVVPARVVPGRITAGRITAGRASAPFDIEPHLVFFLHDEVIVHTPAALADRVAEAVTASAAHATRLLFSTFPIEVPLDVSIVDSYADAP